MYAGEQVGHKTVFGEDDYRTASCVTHSECDFLVINFKKDYHLVKDIFDNVKKLLTH